MKQSSIKWLVTELNQMIDYIPTNKWDAIADIVQQAKQMHKEEIVEAYRSGRTDQQSGIDKWYNRSSSGYYEITYGDDTK